MTREGSRTVDITVSSCGISRLKETHKSSYLSFAFNAHTNLDSIIGCGRKRRESSRNRSDPWHITTSDMSTFVQHLLNLCTSHETPLKSEISFVHLLYVYICPLRSKFTLLSKSESMDSRLITQWHTWH